MQTRLFTSSRPMNQTTSIQMLSTMNLILKTETLNLQSLLCINLKTYLKLFRNSTCFSLLLFLKIKLFRVSKSHQILIRISFLKMLEIARESSKSSELEHLSQLNVGRSKTLWAPYLRVQGQKLNSPKIHSKTTVEMSDGSLSSSLRQSRATS
jgi:hypothetical protein